MDAFVEGMHSPMFRRDLVLTMFGSGMKRQGGAAIVDADNSMRISTRLGGCLPRSRARETVKRKNSL